MRIAISLAVMLVALTGRGAEPSVMVWDLGLATNATALAIPAIKKSNPDVVLLQNVRDWANCDRIVQGLRPAQYHVLVCSAFNDTDRQCAILGKAKAYYTWSENWQGGGFALATAIHNGKRIAFFSTMATSQNGREQIVAEVARMGKWEANRPQVHVVGGTFLDKTENISPTFSPALWKEPAPTESQVELFSFPAGSVFDARQVPVSGFPLCPVLAKIELDPMRALERSTQTNPPPAATPVTFVSSNTPTLGVITNPAADLPATNQATLQRAQIQENFPSPWVWILVGGLGAAVLIAVLGIWLAKRRRNRRQQPALITAGSGTPYVVVAESSTPGSLSTTHVVQLDRTDIATHTQVLYSPASPEPPTIPPEDLRAGLLPHLADWLKQKFVQKLLHDRADLVQSQNAATQKALEVDARLGRIERQLREQNETYELRIAELTRELQNAREENRDLIRARISQVKAEMQAAKERLLARSAESED